MDVLWFTSKLHKEKKKRKKSLNFHFWKRGALKILPRQSRCEVLVHFQKEQLKFFEISLPAAGCSIDVKVACLCLHKCYERMKNQAGALGSISRSETLY